MNNGILAWLRASPARHGLALSASVVALGGMVLLQAGGASARGGPLAELRPEGPGRSSFSAHGVEGTLALSQRVLLAGSEQRFFAEITLRAAEAEGQKARAPLSLVVAVDTSGSMSGKKIEDARDAVARLVRDMRDDDEVALVRFDSDAVVLQPLARVGPVRASLLEKIRRLEAGGGTMIPRALGSALDAVKGASPSRARRLVLASDGLDGGRQESEQLARQAAERGLVVSSLGIGLDFDEGYLSAVAQAGHGNFGFVRQGSDLAAFLKKELDEGATTTAQATRVRVALPAGVRLAQAVGAEAREEGGAVSLEVGSLFAGDERRVVLELAATLGDRQRSAIGAEVSWQRVGGGAERADLGRVEVTGSADSALAEASRDGAVLASAASALASRRQMEAIDAYNRGDQAAAQRLIDQNVAALQAAQAAAPAPMASSLGSQASSYLDTKKQFSAAKPGSNAGKASAKSAAEKNISNLDRKKF